MPAPDQSILQSMLDWLAEGRRVALVTVIQTWGSAPQPVGSKLLTDADGNFLGSVSGGCVEASVIAEAADVLASNTPKTLEFGIEDGTAWSVGLACGGKIRIFVEPVGPSSNGASAPEGVYRELAGDLRSRRPAAVVTHLATGAQRLVHSSAELGQDLADALDDALRRDKSVLVDTGDGEVFIDVFNPPVRLVITGAVHIAQALRPMAQALGYDVTIVDPRGAFATEQRFGNAKISHEWPEDVLHKIGVDGRTAVVALTHDPRIDDPALIDALRAGALYVGALGSKRTHAERVERLKHAGLSAADIDRIHAPIGLDIGAVGPAEIALSIMAEITAVQRGKGSKPR
jgi:xanthine dehydrogenase accessory factor